VKVDYNNHINQLLIIKYHEIDGLSTYKIIWDSSPEWPLCRLK